MAKPKTTKSASKKSSAANKLTKLVPGDPPILVGGGGSSFVWIRKDQVPKLIEPAKVPGGAPHPQTPGLYYVFKVKDSHVKVVVHDGNTVPGSSTQPVNGNKYLASFE
jgi:hypothetical protein